MDVTPFSLLGKKILVTGASSGIGQATAIACADMGADVILTARSEERLYETKTLMATGNHRIICADLTVDSDIESIVSTLEQIDGIVLCTGKGLTLPVQFSTRDKFDEIFDVNFFAPIELLRSLYKKKKINKGGSAVAISSLGGTKIFSGTNSIYGSSKAALRSIMKYCAKEFAPRKIRVNCICPGMVDTPLIHRGTVSEEQLKEDMNRYPLKRYGTPSEIAYAAVYLLSDVSAWMTGQDLILDGGISIS